MEIKLALSFQSNEYLKQLEVVKRVNKRLEKEVKKLIAIESQIPAEDINHN